MIERFLAPLGRRLLALVPVAIGVCALTFFMLHVAPGDPVRSFLGDKASPEAIEALRAQLGFDQPLIVQFGNFVFGLFRGDLGFSVALNQPVGDLVAARLPVSLTLMVTGTLCGVLIALPLALLAARKPGSLADEVIRVIAAVMNGIPAFLIGTALISALALGLGWFPVGGYGEDLPQQAQALVLPSLTLGLSMLPMLTRGFRDAIARARSAEPVSFARSKGLGGRPTLRDYILRPASVPMVSLIGIQLGALVGGVVVIENVFAIPGMGTLMMTGILARDFGLVQGVTVVLAGLTVLIFVINDLAMSWLDPRVKIA